MFKILPDYSILIVMLYLFVINTVTTIVYIKDRYNEKNKRKQVSELTLHLLELAGGIFILLILSRSTILKQKSSKYSFWTILIYLLWATIIFLIR